MTDTHRTPQPDTAAPGALEILRLGVFVWISEMKWLSYALLRRFEISRLAKRLKEEYTRLGRLAEAPRGRKKEKDLCLKQVSFLKDEISALEEELEARRIQRVNTLRARQGGRPVDEPAKDEPGKDEPAKNGPTHDDEDHSQKPEKQ